MRGLERRDAGATRRRRWGRPFLASLTVAGGLVGSTGSVSADAGPTVAIFGDSLTLQAAPYLEADLAPATFIDDYTGGVAPCDWLRPEFVKAIATQAPSIAIIETAGFNHWTACMTTNGTSPDPGTPAFTEAYERAMAAIVGDLVSANPNVVIVYLGAPPMRSPVLNREGEVLFAFMRSMQASVGSSVLHVDFGPREDLGVGGQFALHLPCLTSESRKDGCAHGEVQVRMYDGIHFYCHMPPGLFDWTCTGGYDAGAVRWARAVQRGVASATRG